MKQLAVISVIMGAILISGCDGFRYAATEAQKENAWLHKRVCAMAANIAADEQVSGQLCGLTDLAHTQSEAFVIDYGLPKQVPNSADVETVLSQGSIVAENARVDAANRPDVWTLADSAVELGIALAGLVGGVYGVRIAGYLKTAREKSTALKEVIWGNELFKQLYPEHTGPFKDAQRRQSPSTQQIVSQLKTN